MNAALCYKILHLLCSFFRNEKNCKAIISQSTMQCGVVFTNLMHYNFVWVERVKWYRIDQSVSSFTAAQLSWKFGTDFVAEIKCTIFTNKIDLWGFKSAEGSRELLRLLNIDWDVSHSLSTPVSSIYWDQGPLFMDIHILRILFNESQYTIFDKCNLIFFHYLVFFPHRIVEYSVSSYNVGGWSVWNRLHKSPEKFYRMYQCNITKLVKLSSL